MVPIRGLADIEDLEGVPLAERVPERSINEALRRSAAYAPGKVAMYFLPNGQASDAPVSFTYADLIAGIDAAADLFRELGGEAPVVGLALPNLPQMVVAFLAAQAVGRATLINPLLEAAQITEILRTTRATLVVVPGPALWPEVWAKVATLRSVVPELRQVIVVEAGAASGPGIVPFPHLTTGQSEAEPRAPLRVAEGPGAYFHTGGTTGRPKIAPITDAMQTYAAWVIRTIAGLDEQAVVMGGMPLHHAGGLYINTLAPLTAGGTVVILGPHGYRNRALYPEFWRLIARFRATYFLGVPTVYQALLSTDSAGYDLSSLRYCSCGGAPVAPDVLREFQRRFGVPVLEGYGLTEGGVTSTRNPRDGLNKLGSIGIRHPYQELRIAKLDGAGDYLRECAPGEVGVLAIRGPNVFPGYLQPEFNRGLWIENDWLNTGDLARVDPEGYYWLVGRAKDLIIRGGHNIDPLVIEEALQSHPAVTIAAAVGKPDAYAGEVPVAYVQLRPGAVATEATLLDHARATVCERAAAPVQVFVVESVPTTAVGKIFKPELRWDATRRAVEDALMDAIHGSASWRVEVCSSATNELVATVVIRGVRPADRPPIAREVDVRLSPFPIRHRIEFED